MATYTIKIKKEKTTLKKSIALLKYPNHVFYLAKAKLNDVLQKLNRSERA